MLYNNSTLENEIIRKRLKAPNYNDIHICDQWM